MKVIVLGTSPFTLRCLDAFVDAGCDIVGLVSMPARVLPLNSADMEGRAKQDGIDYYEIEDINADETEALFKNLNPDLIFSSWPKIIGQSILSIPRRMCIGSHPTTLPYNRGRHPLHWLIALGHTESHISFFHMDEGVDAGSLLWQERFDISDTDDIASLNQKMMDAGYVGLKALVAKLNAEPDWQGDDQDQSQACYWRKRSIHDTILDPRMPYDVLDRLVRSFSLPYPCAKLIIDDTMWNIVEVKCVETDKTPEEIGRMEPGKIVRVEGSELVIKVDDGVVGFYSDADFTPTLKQQKYIYPPTQYMTEHSLNLS